MSSSLAVPAGMPATASSQRWLRPVLLFNLVVQSGIVVTGGLVRLTASGLGCTTWPECVPGSYTPVAHQEQGWHKWVEFTNRLAVSVLIAAAVGVFLVVRTHLRQSGKPSRLIFWLSLAPTIGVVVQSVIGGVTVWVTLAPVAVMMHFLPSMVLVACAMALIQLIEPATAEPVPVRAEIRWLTYALAVATAAVLVLGTVVTGSGPHSGDADGRADRFAFDPRTVSWIHADSVWVFVGIALALAVALRLVPSPARARKSSLHLIAAILLQGGIGYLQYFTGLPVAVVALHLLGSAVIAAGATALVVEVFRSRPDAPDATPA